MTMGAALATLPLSSLHAGGRPALEPVGSPRLVPDFRLIDLDGNEHAPENYRGRILMLNFWATWCSPCRAEMDSMARLSELMQGQPFTMLAVAMSQTREQLRHYSVDNPHPFPLLADTDGKVSETFGVQGLPTTYIAARSGRLVYRAQGGRQWDSPRMQRAFDLLLSG